MPDLLSPPPPLRLERSADKGRYLVTSAGLPVGSVVVAEDALVCCPVFFDDTASHLASCLHCADYCDDSLLILCESCGRAFCSAACEQRGARLHAAECAYLERMAAVAMKADIDAQIVWVAFRLVLLLALYGTHHDMAGQGHGGEAQDEQRRLLGVVMELESHEGKFPPEQMAGMVLAAEGILALLPAHLVRRSRCTVPLLVRMLCVYLVNGFDVGHTRPDLNASGTALFLLASLVSHSCEANCHFHGERGRMEMRATRDLAPGEELTVSYVQLDLPTAERQRSLARTKFFRCRCPRCASPSEKGRYVGAMTCPHRSCRGAVVDLSAAACANTTSQSAHHHSTPNGTEHDTAGAAFAQELNPGPGASCSSLSRPDGNASCASCTPAAIAITEANSGTSAHRATPPAAPEPHSTHHHLPPDPPHRLPHPPSSASASAFATGSASGCGDARRGCSCCAGGQRDRGPGSACSFDQDDHHVPAWRCERCGMALDSKAAAEAVQKAKALLGKSQALWRRGYHTAATDLADAVFGLVGDVLHPDHHLLKSARDNQMKLAAVTHDLSTALRCADQLQHRAARLFPGATLEQGDMLYESAIALLIAAQTHPEHVVLDSIQLATDSFHKAVEIFAILCGPHSRRVANMRKEFGRLNAQLHTPR